MKLIGFLILFFPCFKGQSFKLLPLFKLKMEKTWVKSLSLPFMSDRLFADHMPDQSLCSISATLVKCEVLTVKAMNLQTNTILPETKRNLELENSHTLVFFHTTVIKSSRQ